MYYTLVKEESQNIQDNFHIEIKLLITPKYIEIDFSRAEENAILEAYKDSDIKIILC